MDTCNITTYSLVTTILFVILVYIRYVFKQAFRYWKARDLYYLHPTIPFGNAYNLITRKCTLGELFAQWYTEFKERGLKHGGAYFFLTPVYIPVDPEIIKKILISDFEHFPNHGLYINEEEDPLSGNLLTVEGAYWKTLRSKIPAIFTSAKMKKMFLIIEKMHEQFIKNLNVYSLKNVPVDIKKESVRLTTDEILSCMLGIESNALNDADADIMPHGKLFFENQMHVNTTSVILAISRSTLLKYNFRITSKKVENYFITLCQRVIDYKLNCETKRGDLADTLIRLSRKDLKESDISGRNIMKPLTLGQVTGTICGFYAAGYETTSSTISFAMYELAKNPDCQAKLREDISKVLSRYDNKITYDSLMEMKYLDYVVDETLRLYPVLPILPRVCAKDYHVPGTDFVIEKGTLVLITNLGIQRDAEYYPNPDQFDPDRFSPDNKSRRPCVAYLPFGDGPRICVGKRLGLMQAKLGILTVIRNFEVTLNDKTKKTFNFEPKELMLRKAGNIWLNLKKIST